MRAVFSDSDCHPYREGYRISLSLINPVTGRRGEVDATIDTGFDGFLMLESETYFGLSMEVCETPQSQFPTFRTLSGTTVFKSSSGRALIAGRELAVEVISPLHGGGKNLLGRRALQEFTTLLHKRETSCVGDARVES